MSLLNAQRVALGTKLLGLVIGVSAISLALIGLMAYTINNAIHKAKVDTASAAAEGLIDKIDRNLFERYGDVQAYAVSEPARSGDIGRINDFISDMIVTYAPIYDLMIVTNAKGNVIAVNAIDKSGKPLNTSSLIGKDYSQTTWFKAAINGEIKPGTSYVEDLNVDQDVRRVVGTSGRVMNFTAPIRDKVTGTILGVWSNRVSWDDVIETITKEEITKIKQEETQDVFAFITDKNGKYMVHPLGAEMVSNGIIQNFAKIKDDKKTAVNFFSEKIKDFEGEVVQAVSPSKGYSTYPGRGWFAAVHIESEDSLTTMSFYIIIVAFSLMLIVSIIAAVFIKNVMRGLLKLAESLDHETEKVRATSKDFSANAQDLSDATAQQASAVQETAASIEEINAMVRKSTDNARQSCDVATASFKEANRGKESIQQMIISMGEINTSNQSIVAQVEEGNRQITDITKVITEIGNKTKVINDIVFQTKLLSFNASVEAARAGEHGKGFAVVADEVGKLAQMSGNAAKEISDMLNASISKVDLIVNDTKARVEEMVQKGKHKVEQGMSVANQCGEILERIVTNVGEVNTMVNEISTAMIEQSHGITEITKAMGELDLVTHSISSASQKSASSSDNLAVQADALFAGISSLNQLVNGSDTESGSVSASVLSIGPSRSTKALSMKRKEAA